MSNVLGRVATWALTRPRPIVAAAVMLALIAALAAALRLSPDAGVDTLVDDGSEAFVATERFKQSFGDDAVVVLVRGDLRGIVAGENLGRLLGLEGCLAGSAPQGAELPAVDACGELAGSDAVRVVYGPATFLNQSVIQANLFLDREIEAALAEATEAGRRAARRAQRRGLSEDAQRQASEATSAAVLGEIQAELGQLAGEFGQTGLPRLDDPGFVNSIVFDGRLDDGTPKSRFSYLFPSSEAALISVRLRPDLPGEERRRTIELIRDAVDAEQFQLAGATYVVSGVPVVIEGLAAELRGELALLGVVALAVMTIVLLLVFGPPLRLLSLAIALAAAGLTFGLLAALGGSLTMGSIAVLPVLIGLAVDYAIQLQARFREAAAQGLPPAPAALAAATRGGPVIGTAALASAAGFGVLLLSPIPIVRSFGLLLVAGIAFAFALALTAGLAALSLASPAGGERAPRGADGSLRRPPPALRSLLGAEGWPGRVASGLRAATASLAAARSAAWARLRDFGKAALALAIVAPRRVLAVAAVLAIAGWAVGTRAEVVSDIRELVPADLPALEGVDDLQAATGVSGEIDVVVSAPDVTDPEVIAWMADFKARVLARHGFTGRFPDCRAKGTELCPAVALPDLFGGEEVPSRSRVRSILRAVPPYFSQAVLASEGDGGDQLANIAFGIRVMPLADQKRLIDELRAELDPASPDGPPPGVEAAIVGLPVLAADANEELAGSRYWLTLVGLGAVTLVLLAVYRSPRRALVPLMPIALATGWSALVLALIGIPLNPMSASLGALVIAIATEFSVILSARYDEQRATGASVGEALRVTYARTGAAVLASGTTALAGFAVLTASGITMLRDFGLVAVVDLGVALGGVMLVLPAALVWAESSFRPASGLGAPLRRRADAQSPARPARRSGGVG
jgi:hydrophobe/amphiphile efflux-3 (HAE3) family protein